MNFTLFRSTLKSNWLVLFIFTLLTIEYLMMILSLYTPDFLETLQTAIEMVPTDIVATVGMDQIPTSFIDFVAVYFYGFLIRLFLTIHLALLPLMLMVKYVDRGSMSYLLSTPNSRLKIVITQAVYMAVSLFAMMFVVTATALVYIVISHSGAMDIPAFISLNFTVFLTSLAMGSIVFFFSCTWNSMKYAAMCGPGVLGLFFVLSLIGRYGHSEGIYAVIESFSIFKLLESRKICMGEVNMLLNNGLLILIITVFIGISIYIFKKKDLPL